MGKLSETDMKMLEKAATEFLRGDNWKKLFLSPKMRRPKGQDYPSLKGKGYLEILEGAYGDEYYFWIMPVKIFNAKPDGDLRNIEFFPKGQISIDEDYIMCFLRVFVEKYLNKDFKVWGTHFDFEGFEWWGENIYSYSDIKKMLKEITETAKLLEKDYDNPVLDKVKKDYNYHYLIYSHIPGLTEEGENNVIKKNIGVVTDFYRRFVKRIELMMKRYPDCTHIAFEYGLEGTFRMREEEWLKKSKHP
ncbi:hypothetical protein SAMN02745671_00866 [Anaerovibrio lipolyticus DSM 3074]|uniref:Uncharacterized protein n=1 Tax=Anaerovibrio lipolyticus DSM 3074 TaxID=1120997 RepID=A0A1M6BVJ2_9FIRM|nr:hypothetical protein [Anaerovibrio lipolyticus]SHI52806.1 hypothetical protein SAMN02745671_00866 [Anaerovibrio lipolyticus DSM 3074]